jgi:hypothetical protein
MLYIIRRGVYGVEYDIWVHREYLAMPGQMLILPLGLFLLQAIPWIDCRFGLDICYPNTLLLDTGKGA